MCAKRRRRYRARGRWGVVHLGCWVTTICTATLGTNILLGTPKSSSGYFVELHIWYQRTGTDTLVTSGGHAHTYDTDDGMQGRNGTRGLHPV